MNKGTIIAIAATALIGTIGTVIAGNSSKDKQVLVDKNSAWTTTATPAASATPEKKETKKNTPAPKAGKKGTYRCWSFNVAGSSQKCTSPSIVLNADGSYSMSSEKGTYKITGDQILLSESKIRGPGTFKEGQKQIVFNYDYNGKNTTVTYLNYDDPDNNKGKMVSVKLNVIFPEGDDRAKWLSSVSLTPYEGLEVYDALSQSDGEHKIVAEYREVESAKKYKVMAGPSEVVGEVDLTNAKGHAEFTVYVNGAKETPKVEPKVSPKPASEPKKAPAPKPEVVSTPIPEPEIISEPIFKPKPKKVEEPTPAAPAPEPEVTPTPAPAPEPEISPYAGKPCDPNIPHYSQPGCID